MPKVCMKVMPNCGITDAKKQPLAAPNHAIFMLVTDENGKPYVANAPRCCVPPCWCLNNVIAMSPFGAITVPH